MTDKQAIVPPSGDQNEAADGRTRRNVIAMTGIVAATLAASAFAVKNAEARDRGGWGGGWGGGGGGGGGSGAACFLTGTMIRTENGDVAVENLREGDKLPTILGQTRAIKQIRSWSVERKAGHKWTDDVAPIKVSRSALGPNVPENDLYLSPAHALYVDNVLIVAGKLVNGGSIVRCSDHDVPKLTYFHVELEDHQVIWAQGAPVESHLMDPMVPFAPIYSGGRRFELASRFRSALSPWIDKRDTFDKVRDRLDARSEAAFAI